MHRIFGQRNAGASPRIERGRSWQVTIPKPSLTACNSTFLFLLSKYAPGGHKINAL